MLLILVACGALIGCLVTVWLPARMQPVARGFLSVPLGWTVLTLIATLWGWIGHGYAAFPCAAVTIALTGAGAWVNRKRLRYSGDDCLRLTAFTIVASFPFLGPLLHHGSFSLYNDTFLYHGQSLWLQHHGFRETADTGGGHPIWGTVILMQAVPLRMGASFLLGWVQASFGLAWPHEAFPAVAALGVICGALSVGATLLAACPGRRPEAWLTALAVAVTVNGFAFGAAHGFLPQTWGLAFVAAAFALRGLELSDYAKKGQRDGWFYGVLPGLCAAASMHCYWDLLPLEGPALACAYLLPWPGQESSVWRKTCARAAVPLTVCVGLVNLEWLRAARGILNNIRVVAANPVAWRVWDFPAHALGFKSSIWERSRWLAHDLPASLLLAGCAAVTVWLGIVAVSLRHPTRWHRWLRSSPRLARWLWQPLVPAMAWMALSVLLFCYFRYLVPSPWQGQERGDWTDGVGQSWSQYKVTIWSSFALIGLTAALLTGLTMRVGTSFSRALLIVILTVWCGAGLGWNFRIVRWRGEQLLLDTGVRQYPLNVCLAMRRKVSAIPEKEWIYLDWPSTGQSDKFRELMVYFLYDHPLASNWSTGISLAPYVTSVDAQRTAQDCQWVLKYQPPAPDPTGRTLAQPVLTLERNPLQPLPE